ncbi:MAG: hypothetical protein WBD20_19460 [Pirellulaceae bacterium]
MKLSLKSQLRRIALACLIAGASFTATLVSPLSLFAHDTVPVPARHTDASPVNADWCVWTESNTCNYQVELETETTSHSPDKLANEILRPRAISRTASSFETSIAAVAATACARAGISVEQLVEPFAMVGPDSDNSIEQITELRDWWAVAQEQVETQYNQLIQIAEAKAIADNTMQNLATAADTVADDVLQGDVVEQDVVSLVPLVDFRSELPFSNSWSPRLASVPTAIEGFEISDASEVASARDLDSDVAASMVTSTVPIRETLSQLAQEEPIDTDVDSLRMHGGSILVTQSSQPTSAADDFQPTTSLVGSSAMIVTIEEVYMPYDLAARDVQVSSLFPMVKRPFCIRSRMELPGLPPADSQDAEPSIAPDDLNETQVADASAPEINASLEQIRWHVEKVAGHFGIVHESLRPTSLGQQLAVLMVGQNKLARQVALQLAQTLPNDPPVPAGIQPKGNQPGGNQPSAAGAKLLARAEVTPADNATDFDADQALADLIAHAQQSSRAIRLTLAKYLSTETSIARSPAAEQSTENDASRR